MKTQTRWEICNTSKKTNKTKWPKIFSTEIRVINFFSFIKITDVLQRVSLRHASFFYESSSIVFHKNSEKRNSAFWRNDIRVSTNYSQNEPNLRKRWRRGGNWSCVNFKLEYLLGFCPSTHKKMRPVSMNGSSQQNFPNPFQDTGLWYATSVWSYSFTWSMEINVRAKWLSQPYET